MTRFVDESITHWVPLPDESGDRILIRDRLPYGLRQKVMAAAITSMPMPEEGEEADIEKLKFGIDLAVDGPTRIKAWVLDWDGPGFIDKKGHRVKLTDAAIQVLDVDTAKLIHQVINEQVEKLEELKKEENGKTSSEPTSQSANGWDGPTTS